MNVFLTFDDGPNEPYTSQILDILKKFEAKASFFVCGKNVERFPAIARRIVKEGHAIGNHTYSHSLVASVLGLLRKEIEKTDGIIFAATGVKTGIFRPPWGILLNPWLKRYLKRSGHKIVFWDIAVGDWFKPEPELILKRITNRTESGDIILLHDGKETSPRADRSHVVSALPKILQELKGSGFVFNALEK